MAKTPAFRARPRDGHYAPVGKLHSAEKAHTSSHSKAAAHDATRDEVRKSFRKQVPKHAARSLKD